MGFQLTLAYHYSCDIRTMKPYCSSTDNRVLFLLSVVDLYMNGVILRSGISWKEHTQSLYYHIQSR